MRKLVVVVIAALLAACGFQLRGSSGNPLPYRSIYLAMPDNTDVAIALRRYLAAVPTTQLVRDKDKADAVFQQVADRREKTILSLNAQGQVREYRLQAIYSFRVLDPKGREIVPVNEITLLRDITFNDSAILAKNLEENLLWRDINYDLVSQIIRRLSIVKPKSPEDE